MLDRRATPSRTLQIMRTASTGPPFFLGTTTTPIQKPACQDSEIV
jgi:hypothetical protein